MAVRALLFDFDGLIVDTETPSLRRVARSSTREHGQELRARPLGGGGRDGRRLRPARPPRGARRGRLDRDAVQRPPARARAVELVEASSSSARAWLAYLAEAGRAAAACRTAIGVQQRAGSGSTATCARLEQAAPLRRDRHRRPRLRRPRQAAARRSTSRRSSFGPAAAPEAIAFEDSLQRHHGRRGPRASYCRRRCPTRVTATLGLDAADLVDSLASLPLSALLRLRTVSP